MAKAKKVVKDLTEEPAEVVTEATEVTETLVEETSSEDADEATEGEAQTEEPAEVRKHQAMPAWFIKVDCPTPLASNPKTVSAVDEATAWQVFCLQNGIVGTDHPKTITRI